jgi:hypothetical protein
VISSRRSLVAIVLAAGLGASACTSDPSPNRVAEDLVRTLASTPEEEECMLDIVDEYELNDLGEDASSENPDVAGPAQEELDRFEADLAACRE